MNLTAEALQGMSLWKHDPLIMAATTWWRRREGYHRISCQRLCHEHDINLHDDDRIDPDSHLHFYSSVNKIERDGIQVKVMVKAGDSDSDSIILSDRNSNNWMSLTIQRFAQKLVVIHTKSMLEPTSLALIAFLWSSPKLINEFNDCINGSAGDSDSTAWRQCQCRENLCKLQQQPRCVWWPKRWR